MYQMDEPCGSGFCGRRRIVGLRIRRGQGGIGNHGCTATPCRQHVIKTLIMEDENAKPLVILMHGDCEVSTKNLARQIGAKHVSPCKPEQAQRNSGYFVGGTSPFGTKKHMPVYVESSI